MLLTAPKVAPWWNSQKSPPTRKLFNASIDVKIGVRFEAGKQLLHFRVAIVLPQWLENWEPWHTTILKASRQEVEREIARWEPCLRPADPKAVAVLLERTLELFGVPDNWDEIADFYFEAFEDMPVDLVEKALKHARQHCRFFPKPVELRESILEEWDERRRPLLRLGAILSHARFREDDDPPAASI